jgi:hypothetical protein
MAKYFVNPFAVAGNKTPVPDTIQGDGSVSYEQGFGPDYSRNKALDPLAKDVPRDQTNELYFDITQAVQQYQQLGTPDFITSVDNLGLPFPYAINARVRYNPGSGFKTYQSLANSNTALPTDTTKWLVVDVPSTGYVTPLQIQKNNFISATDTGVANAAVATTNPVFTPETATTVIVRMSHNNTGSATLNVNGQGAETIYKYAAINSSNVPGLQTLSPNDLIAGMEAVFLQHNSGSDWILLNPMTVDYRTIQGNLLAQAVMTGTSNTYVASPHIPYLAYEISGSFSKITLFNAGSTNGPGAATLNISGLGAIPILQPYGPFVGGEMVTGFCYEFMLANGEALLLNPTVIVPTPVVESWNGSTTPVDVVAKFGMSIAGGAIGQVAQYARVRFSGATQTIGAGATAVLQFNNVVHDPNGWWNAGSHRMIPNRPGKYRVNCYIKGDLVQGEQLVAVRAATEYSELAQDTIDGGVANDIAFNVSSFLIECNGTTDWVQMEFTNGGATSHSYGEDNSYFELTYEGA